MTSISPPEGQDKTLFTPGPWSVAEATPENGWCQDAGWLVLGADGNWFMDGLTEPDARLIAAAPALYAALEHILNGSLSLPRFAEEEARAALNQVRAIL